MKKIKHLFILLSHLSGGRWGIAVISTILPVLIMALFGVGLAFKYGYLLPLSLTVATGTLVVSIPLISAYRSSKQDNTMSPEAREAEPVESAPDNEQGLVKPSQDWSEAELKIWQRSRAYGNSLLEQDDNWSNLDTAGLSILEFVAVEYDKKALDFTVPEGLKLFEEVSRRYRVLLDEYGFAVDAVKVSHIKSGYDLYDRYGDVGKHVFKAAIWLNHAKNLYINPAKAIADIGTQQFSANMTRGMVDDLQFAAKQALIDEVAFVAIELYSGRFSFDDIDVTVSQIARADRERTAVELEPIRIVLVGQTGAGKSSLINELKEEFVAEVDVLPSTDHTTTYRAMVGEQPIVIVDLPGFDGSEQIESSALSEVVQADVVLWVLKASQSARALDTAFQERLEEFYAHSSNISRKRPVVLGVLNQVDKLQPQEQWQPPFELSDPKSEKEQMIVKAMAFNQQLLGFYKVLPLSISDDKPHFGVDELRHWLGEGIVDAFNVQRNRQRLEAAKRGKGLKKQWDRISKTGKKAAPSLIKAAVPKALDSLTKKWHK
ncbi:GTPase RsgA [Vibrio astriarenae]|uniref:GTPase RsgA n=1 Tax=Vibrio astriarenae TaxID=1481923 RepID=A0A7Z2T343_9VIBR|nr:GTPase [Vibrio astriarenae]QIA63493.1 GTPase RsgA [Vibrio astriarenae]